MDLNSKHSCDFSYHNITRSQISIDKYNGESKRINIPKKIFGQEVVEIGSKYGIWKEGVRYENSKQLWI